ncbi:aquaporin family protein [Flagellimonas alvinocaridis]|uniref:Aquaporin family protein n=1 Tax=Flagellimonas alvinocaridis TaxID=2530200 RepID=A0A4S8RQN2_9FLAO|nr:MIP/aquaporin family protein [Allomuricauda alvinocaridis]THV60983.1 aquaporin family protein [Allomuricauda alvinocaridis]
MTAFIAEIIGTFFLILMGNGVVANVVLNKTKGNNSGWIVITTGWALAVFIGVVVAGPYSGAHLNPAVSIGLAIVGKFSWELVPTYAMAQMFGAMLGSLTVWALYRNHYRLTDDPDAIRATFCTSPAIRDWPSNLLSEVIGTFSLIFVIFYFSDPLLGEGNTQAPIGMGSLGAVPVSLLVFVIGLALGGTTGYAINPARDFGPRIMHALLPIKKKEGSDWNYSSIPIAGPIIGSILAALFYLLLS